MQIIYIYKVNFQKHFLSLSSNIFLQNKLNEMALYLEDSAKTVLYYQRNFDFMVLEDFIFHL